MEPSQHPSTLRGPDLFVAVVDSLLTDGIGVRFRAEGGSMSPTVRNGEYLIVAPIDRTREALRVNVGDIVLCQLPRGPVAHRVVAIESPSNGSPRFTLCGDAAPDCDRLATADQLRGMVIGVERDGRLVSLSIAGGRLGRFALLAALRLRRAIRAARIRRTVAVLTA